MHVVDPIKYPLAADALYRPRSYTVDDALAFEASFGFDKVVIVQPSIYGNDNGCLLGALESLGLARARAIVAFTPGTICLDVLRAWDQIGVRGVRVNLSSWGRSVDAHDLKTLLHQYANACRPLNWVIQIYLPMEAITLLEPIVPTLNVKVCIDHLGHPPSLVAGSHVSPYQLAGFSSLISLLKDKLVTVKMSAPYRLCRDPTYMELKPMAQELLRVGGREGVIFGTDWPHTRFSAIDIQPWIERVVEWCDNDAKLIERLFKGTPEDLWG